MRNLLDVGLDNSRRRSAAHASDQLQGLTPASHRIDYHTPIKGGELALVSNRQCQEITVGHLPMRKQACAVDPVSVHQAERIGPENWN